MPVIDQTSLHNHLLRRLAPEDLDLLARDLEPVALCKGAVLNEPGQPFEHATFPDNGIISLISISSKGRTAESGLVGREGFTPTGLVMDAGRSSRRCIVQVAGRGHRIAADALREALEARPALHRVLLHFVYALGTQTSHTALSNAVHAIDERLARWLLMCHDRVSGDALLLTHEFLSIMLGVRRPSITTALHVLEGRRLVQARMGHITVTDRPGLEAFAGDAYGPPEAEYERLLGPMRQGPA